MNENTGVDGAELRQRGVAGDIPLVAGAQTELDRGASALAAPIGPNGWVIGVQPVPPARQACVIGLPKLLLPKSDVRYYVAQGWETAQRQ